MQIVVDQKPKEPKECVFHEKTYTGNYVCKLQHSCIVCNPDKCKFLKPISEYCYD